MPVSSSSTPAPASPLWHATDGDAALATLHSQSAGLSAAEAAQRLSQYGPNTLAAAPGKPAWRRLLDQVTEPLVLVLLASGIVTALLGEWVDSGVILGVVVVNALIGFIQEGKAEQALAALARAVSTEVTVRRDGVALRLPSAQLVPGDVVQLAAGDKVPADLRLLRAKELRAAEAALTGESTAVDKHTAALPAPTLLADRANMAYAGTLIVAGQGLGLVVATGNATETGRISRLMAATTSLDTPLTRRMARFSNLLLLIIGGLAVFTFAVGLLRGETAFDMFMAAVALAVGAIPEGLPAAVTITLAIGVSRMARRRAIIRKLPAVETLGSTTVICSDKTGTLTENQMTVRSVLAGDALYRVAGDGYAPTGDWQDAQGQPLPAIPTALHRTLLASLLCNDAALYCDDAGCWQISGDPTEAALLVAARKAGLDERELHAAQPRHDELPFDATRQYMATRHPNSDGEQHDLYAKGALEKLLPRCSHWLDASGKPQPLDTSRRQQIETAALRLASEGQRVLAVAHRHLPADHPELTDAALDADDQGGLTLLGLVGMIDPPRAEAISAIAACRRAGITVKMITGDHAATARAIARQLGLLRSAEATVLTGRELAAQDDATLRQTVREVDVFARVEPEQKLRLVSALQANGEVVAMTGDGVNDAPALKQADIGIAMGITGTEVAKEAAAMVLTDDNFATIEAAVEEGRGVFDNLVKFITWTLPTNFGEGLVIVAAIVAGVTLPITPLQILWINMTTAVLLGLMLAFEPVEAGSMARPPRPPAAPILDRDLLWRTLLVSLLLLGGAFGLFLRELNEGSSLAEARTVAVNVFVLVEMVYLFNCRSLTRSAWSVGLWSNPWVWVGSGLMLALQLAFTYLPVFHTLFKTAPIPLHTWLEMVGIALLAGLVISVDKWRVRQRVRMR